jgi:hypothetical protein
MKKTLLGILFLFALLFIGTAGAVSINYAERQGVTVDSARDSAEATLFNFILSGSSGSTIGSWRGATLASNPTVIYDISGLKYAYQFDVLLKGKTIGEITAAANKLSGKPVLGIDTTQRILSTSSVLSRSTYPRGSVKYTLVVMYENSRIGTLVILQDTVTGAVHRLLFDENAVMISDTQAKGSGLIDYDASGSLFSPIEGSDAELKIQSYESIRGTLVKNLASLRSQMKNPYLTNPEVLTPVIKQTTATTSILSPVNTPRTTVTTSRISNLPGGSSGLRSAAALISGLKS